MLKTLATAAAIAITTLPAMADGPNLNLPDLYGQMPCVKVYVEVKVFENRHELDFMDQSIVQFSNGSRLGTYIQIGDYRFSALTVRIEEGRLTCIGVPLDETASPGSWFSQAEPKSPAGLRGFSFRYYLNSSENLSWSFQLWLLTRSCERV